MFLVGNHLIETEDNAKKVHHNKKDNAKAKRTENDYSGGGSGKKGAGRKGSGQDYHQYCDSECFKVNCDACRRTVEDEVQMIPIETKTKDNAKAKSTKNDYSWDGYGKKGSRKGGYGKKGSRRKGSGKNYSGGGSHDYFLKTLAEWLLGMYVCNRPG